MEKSMRLCGHSLSSRMGLRVYCAVIVVVHILFVCCLVLLIADGVNNMIPISQFILGVGFVLLLLACFSALMIYDFCMLNKMNTRRYRIEEEGIWICDKHKRFYRWEQVPKIAVIKYANVQKVGNDRFRHICVWITEPRPDDIQKLEISSSYGYKNYDRLILIEFSPDIIKDLEASYPGHIEFCPYW